MGSWSVRLIAASTPARWSILGNPHHLTPGRRKALEQEYGGEPAPADLVFQIPLDLMDSHRLQAYR